MRLVRASGTLAVALWAQFSGAPRSCGLVPVNAHVTCNMDAGLAYQLLRHQRLAPRFPRESHLLRANLMPWSPRGQVTAGRSVCGPRALCSGRGSPYCPRSLSSPFHPFALISTQAPLPSSESGGLACGLWVTRGISTSGCLHFSQLRRHVGIPPTPAGTRTSGLGGASSLSRHPPCGRKGRRRPGTRLEIRRLRLAHGYELNTRTAPTATASSAPAMSLTHNRVCT